MQILGKKNQPLFSTKTLLDNWHWTDRHHELSFTDAGAQENRHGNLLPKTGLMRTKVTPNASNRIDPAYHSFLYDFTKTVYHGTGLKICQFLQRKAWGPLQDIPENQAGQQLVNQPVMEMKWEIQFSLQDHRVFWGQPCAQPFQNDTG